MNFFTPWTPLPGARPVLVTNQVGSRSVSK